MPNDPKLSRLEASAVHADGSLDRSVTALLAKRVMGWRTAPGRFLMKNRQWLRDHRFQPTKRIEDAYRVLEKAAPKRYTIGGDETGVSFAEVQIGEVIGEARDTSNARASHTQ
jgi:hypothetical protein